MTRVFVRNNCLILSVMLLQSICSMCLASSWFPVGEMEALHDVYISTQGNTWVWEEDEDTYGARWNFTQHPVSGEYLNNPCSSDESGGVWQGITCSNSSSSCASHTCHVIILDLDSYVLRGTLPATLDALPHLEILNLANNLLVGSIPASVGNLPYLRVLDLRNSYFSEKIPNSLQNLTSLEYLYLHLNFLTGTIPPQLGSLVELRNLYLHTNSLTGSMPEELGRLSRLQRLYLHANSLTGHIPEAFGSMSQMRYLYIYSNQLTGSIPSQIGEMTELIFLIPYANLLTGTIPPELGDLVKLQYLYLNDNYITGHIPTEFGKLVKMENLLLYSTMLSGPLPKEMSSMTRLSNLFCYFSMLTGSIPPEYGALVSMQNLFLKNNFLSGTFPPELGGITSMLFIYIDFNALSGTIPTEFSAMVNIEKVYLNSNSLTGSIPPELGAWTKMSNLYLDQNLLSGTIPSSLGELVLLGDLHLYDNLLTGTIPSELGSLDRVIYLYLDRLFLTGTIPPSFGKLTQVHFLTFYDNMLVGDIPSTLGNLTSLEELIVFNNDLEGTLPTTLSACTSMRILNLQNNWLSGSLEGVFHADMALQNVDLSDNKFSGEIPEGIFDLRDTFSVALSLNCFEGTLPQNMCSARNVSVLSMDGLGAAMDCKGSVQIPFSGVTLFNTLEGTIPSCVWALPRLRVLHLTGNGLRGDIHIDEASALGPAMTTISLAYNKLTGSIPKSMQERGFDFLDLSNNKLAGRLSTVQATVDNTTRDGGGLVLELNRLSGRFPSTSNIFGIGELSALRGNLFDCGSIPEEDEFRNEYSCGSDELDVSLYLFLCVATLVMVLVSVLHVVGGSGCTTGNAGMKRLYEFWKMQKIYVTYLEDYMKDSDVIQGDCGKRVLAKIRAFSTDLRKIKILFRLLVCLHLITCLPLYGLKIAEYGREHTTHTTHSYQFRWLLTAAYMRGEVALMLLLLMWVGVMAALSALTIRRGAFRRWLSRASSRPSSQSFSSAFSLSFSSASSTGKADNTELNENGEITYVHLHLSKLKLFLIFVVNTSVVGCVCGVYIHLTSQSLPPSTTIGLQIGMALFNLVWNMVVVPALSRPLEGVKNVVWTELWLLIFNNILLPSIVTTLTSPACFQGLLVQPDEVTSMYEYEYCAYLVTGDDSVTCRDYAIHEVEVPPLVPPFSYNNICSSVLLTSFIPVFIFVCSFQILFPLLQICLCTTAQYTAFPKPLQKVLFGIFWPEHWRTNDHDSTSVSAAGPDVEDQSAVAEPLKLLKTTRIISTDILSPLLVFCTFGICSPFLAVIMLVLVSLKHYMWVALIGRFVYARVKVVAAAGSGVRGVGGVNRCDDDLRRPSTKQSDRNYSSDTSGQGRTVSEDQALVALSSACVPILNIVSRCAWPIILSSSLFFAFLCWDVLGDKVGWVEALWAPLLVLALPLCLWVYLGVIRRMGVNGIDTGGGENLSGSLCSASSVPSTISKDVHQVDSNPLHMSIKMTEMGARSSTIAEADCVA